ncbi:MAG: hypothetical protein ACLGG0_03450 [Bacteriovoracia bacterium]
MKIVILLCLLVSTSVIAACPKNVRKALGPGKKSLEITSATYRQFGLILSHYRESLMPSFPVEIESVTARYRNGAITGYEVGITDGGDESFVRYVTNARKKPEVAYWSNQSPITFWFCGNRTTISEDETVDGSEIH